MVPDVKGRALERAVHAIEAVILGSGGEHSVIERSVEARQNS